MTENQTQTPRQLTDDELTSKYFNQSTDDFPPETYKGIGLYPDDPTRFQFEWEIDQYVARTERRVDAKLAELGLN